MAALSRVMHDESASDAPLSDRLLETVKALVRVGGEELRPSEIHP
jgi:hypothetical protein